MYPESKPNMYYFFLLFIVMFSEYSNGFLLEKRPLLIDYRLVLKLHGTSLNIKKMKQEEMTELMTQEQMMQLRMNQFYYAVVMMLMMMMLFFHFPSLLIFFLVSLLTVVVQGRTKMQSFSSTTIVIFFLLREILALTLMEQLKIKIED